jgi:2-polyprenyl-3-methyl-5-hydroxy-6-metoxy-1,4-benzoquinol methylase
MRSKVSKLIAIDKNYRRQMEEIYRGLLQRAAPREYDENALPSYTHPNQLMAWLFWKRIDIALRFMGDMSGKNILDFGCGGAVTFKCLNQKQCRIVRCDENIVLAQLVFRALNINAELYGDLSAIDGRKFDYILALDLLEHIENSGALLNKFKDMMQPGSKIILSGPTENFWYKLGRKLAGFSGYYHVKNIHQIEREFGAMGFRAEKVRTLYYPCPYLGSVCGE